MKTLRTAAGAVLGAVVVAGVFALLASVFALLLMLLMNWAFPALAFNFWQALALLGIFTLIGLPAMVASG